MSSDFQVIVVVLLCAIVFNLGRAMFHMSSGPDHSGQMVRALSWRIGLSVALFLLLIAGARLHLFAPHAAL
jgi:hypothetical protein